jgi:hypothetical protein
MEEYKRKSPLQRDSDITERLQDGRKDTNNTSLVLCRMEKKRQGKTNSGVRGCGWAWKLRREHRPRGKKGREWNAPAPGSG